MSWRLPSGQALAEFALQTGFLAPLMMRAPKVKRSQQAQPLEGAMASAAGKQVEEAPARAATFRQNR